MIERLLEMGISGVIVLIFAFSTGAELLDDVFENLLAAAFGAAMFYFISLYGLSCILFGLFFRSTSPRRHAKIMTAAFCIHVIGFFLFFLLWDLYIGGGVLESPEQVLKERLLPMLMIAANGIPAVWIANYVGGVFYRWAIARSGKTMLTS
jgi:hypothetical protein